MNNAVESLLGQINQVNQQTAATQPFQLLSLLTLNPQVNPIIAQINNVSPRLNDKQIDALVARYDFYNGEWNAFNEVVASFIKLSHDLNAWSMLESFDLYGRYLNDLSVAFTNNRRGALLVPLVSNSVDIIIGMATKLDTQLYLKENCQQPRLTYIATLLLKIFNNIRSQASEETSNNGGVTKKQLILYMGVKLCQVYFKIDNPLLCRNIFSNMGTAQLTLSRYPLGQQIQYRFHLARFYLIKYQFIDAYQHLSWCFDRIASCQNDGAVIRNNMTRLLKLWIPTGIIIGRTPRIDLIVSQFYSHGNVPSFLTLYQQISDCVKRGDLSQFNEIVNNNPHHYNFLKANQLLVALNSKCTLLTVRNLVKRVWLQSSSPTTIKFDDLKLALRLSTRNMPVVKMNSVLDYIEDDQTIENILISLIDQNLLRGKLIPNWKQVTLSKTNAFPSVASINFVKFGHGKEGTLSGGDKWMLQ